MSLEHISAVRQRGFGLIAVIIVLVIMASMAAGLLTLGTTQQMTSAQDILSARALAAARTGTDIGLFKALSSTTPLDPWKTCSNLSQTLDLSTTTGFRVTITCDSTNPPYNEGESVPGTANVVRFYRIQATACNSSSACPDAIMATSPAYIERVRLVTATN